MAASALRLRCPRFAQDPHHREITRPVRGRLGPALAAARDRLLDFCADWAANGSRYALVHYPEHLADTDPERLPDLYTDVGYLSAVITTLGIDQVTDTFRRRTTGARCPQADAEHAAPARARSPPPRPTGDSAAGGNAGIGDAGMRGCGDAGMRGCGDAGIIARQVALQALCGGEAMVAARAADYLRSACPAPRLVPRSVTAVAPSPALQRTLAGHAGAVVAVALTRDGRRAVTTSWDHSARVWDLDAGAELALARFDSAGRSIAVTQLAPATVVVGLAAGITVAIFDPD